MTTLRTGGCLCGAIRYESSGEPVFALQCHCRDCQRQTGSAYVAAVRVPAAEFRITKGKPKHYIAKADSGNEITRVFCPDCGSPITKIWVGQRGTHFCPVCQPAAPRRKALYAR